MMDCAERRIGPEALERARELYKLHEQGLEEYLDRLLWWNRKVNLVSREVSRETLREHVVHSLVPSVLSVLDSAGPWIDAGSGGGLPGLPLALCNPGQKWILNDVVLKKMTAVRQIVHELGLANVTAEAVSAERLDIPAGAGIISKHAFSVAGLAGMVSGKKWKKIVMLKGVEEARVETGETEYAGDSEIHVFEFGKNEPFYAGKGILVIEQHKK